MSIQALERAMKVINDPMMIAQELAENAERVYVQFMMKHVQSNTDRVFNDDMMKLFASCNKWRAMCEDMDLKCKEMLKGRAEDMLKTRRKK